MKLSLPLLTLFMAVLLLTGVVQNSAAPFFSATVYSEAEAVHVASGFENLQEMESETEKESEGFEEIFIQQSNGESAIHGKPSATFFYGYSSHPVFCSQFKVPIV